MNKQCVVVTLLATIITICACQKKSTPTVATRSIEVEAPKPVTVNFTPDTIAGKSIYMTRCDRCHGLPDIQHYTSKRWEAILNSMIPRARLSKEDGAHVTAYIKLNCTK